MVLFQRTNTGEETIWEPLRIKDMTFSLQERRDLMTTLVDTDTNVGNSKIVQMTPGVVVE